ncbi:tetratricopeptide repeat protein [Polaribacter sp.]|uniref:tetratricopeptide repeat protein n=1 Tax=Polaribacter sp. TaxID=1920175 RepID=UPI003EF41A3B
MKKAYKTIIFIFIFFLLLSCISNQLKNENKELKAKNFNDVKTLYLKYKKEKNDSLYSESLLNLVRFSYKEKRWQQFHQYRLEHLSSKTLKNFTKTNAKISDYSGFYFWDINKLDSAYAYYYKAFKIYNELNDSLKASKVLLNIAIIQKNIFNFNESETTSFKTLTYLKNSNKKQRVASIYNNLGVTYKGLDDFKNSLKYHTKAYNIRKKLKNGLLEIHSLNNIGNVYKEQKEYKKAIINYETALSFDSILQVNIETKAILLDNYAFALFLNKETTKIPKLFFEALKIRDSIQNIPGQIVSNIHLGIYYKSLGEKETALKYLETAKNLSKSINYKKDELEAMELLLDVYPPKQALETAKQILLTRDSLKKVERKINESISRIQYETSEKEKTILVQEKKIQNEVLANNKKKIVILVFVILFISILLILLYLWFLNYKQKQQFKNGFTQYLKNKYSLTTTNLEFWENLIMGFTQDELADKLCISINGIKSRRKALFAKIKTTNNNNGSLDKAKAILLYKKEAELFKKNTSK